MLSVLTLLKLLRNIELRRQTTVLRIPDQATIHVRVIRASGSVEEDGVFSALPGFGEGEFTLVAAGRVVAGEVGGSGGEGVFDVGVDGDVVGGGELPVRGDGDVAVFGGVVLERRGEGGC